MATLIQQLIALAGAVRDKFNVVTPRLLPSGGAVNDVLVRNAAGDYAVGWVAPGGGASLGGVATITLPAMAGAFEHQEIVAAPGVSAEHRIMITLAPTNGDDENEIDMIDLLFVTAMAAAGSIAIYARFLTATSGPIKFNWSAG